MTSNMDVRYDNTENKQWFCVCCPSARHCWIWPNRSKHRSFFKQWMPSKFTIWKIITKNTKIAINGTNSTCKTGTFLPLNTPQLDYMWNFAVTHLRKVFCIAEGTRIYVGIISDTAVIIVIRLSEALHNTRKNRQHLVIKQL